jgi:carbamoyl-phosphate synthase small subunit
MSNGYIVREWCDVYSDGNEINLDEYLKGREIVGICGVDTRRLTRYLRDKGYMKGAITDSLDNIDDLLEEINNYTISGAVREITIKEPIKMNGQNVKYNVVAVDFGSPRKQLNAFLLNGCDVTLVPAFTTADEIMTYKPDGIVLCDGPADPDDEPEFIKNIAELISKDVPVFAIGLGHQMLALANGFKIVKMEKGHRGSNQPVKIEGTKKIMVTDQNHGYAVDSASVSDVAEIIMTNINDNTVEGLKYNNFKGLSVQFTPKGDIDSSTGFIIRDFFKMMDGENND